jgi:hypothetical protein
MPWFIGIELPLAFLRNAPTLAAMDRRFVPLLAVLSFLAIAGGLMFCMPASIGPPAVKANRLEQTGD